MAHGKSKSSWTRSHRLQYLKSWSALGPTLARTKPSNRTRIAPRVPLVKVIISWYVIPRRSHRHGRHPHRRSGSASDLWIEGYRIGSDLKFSDAAMGSFRMRLLI